MQIRVIFALPLSSLVPLPWCPGQLFLSPTSRSSTACRNPITLTVTNDEACSRPRCSTSPTATDDERHLCDV